MLSSPPSRHEFSQSWAISPKTAQNGGKGGNPDASGAAFRPSGRVCGGADQGTAAAGCDTIGATTNIRRVLSGSSRSQRHRLE